MSDPPKYASYASARHARQRGGIMLMAAPLVACLLAMTALAIDVSRILLARSELQNAADAAALAGAARLDSYISPNWLDARSAALAALSNNRAANRMLTAGDVDVGFWPITGNGPLRSWDDGPTSPQLGENPAVRVRVSLRENVNGGALTLLFAPIFQRYLSNVTAQAVGVIATPGFASEGSLFPMVLNKCMFDQFWSNGVPNDPDQVVRIGSAYHYPNCSAGQWSSLDLFSQSAKVTKTLLSTGNTIELALEDEIYIQSGTETSIYGVVQDLITAKGGSWDVLIPVVDTPDLSQSGSVPIVAFAPFRLTASVGGNDKYIEGRFIENYKAPGTSGGAGGGAFFGATTPALLAD